MTIDLRGQRVLVVGAAGGIGKTTAEAFASLGATVAAAGRTTATVDAVAEAVGGEGFRLDMLDNNQVEAFFAHQAPFDHVVITAASTIAGSVSGLSLENAKAAMESKFWGAYRISRAAKVNDGGSITFVSGVLAQRPSATSVLQGAIRERPLNASAAHDGCRIPPQSGVGFTLSRGDVLRVTDPSGEQVSDLFAFGQDDRDCALSSGRSIDYASRIYLTTGDVLYANDSKPMFTIVDDTVGRHDFLLTPCSQEMFEILHHVHGHHPSCFANLRDAFAAFDIDGARIGTTFNIFMNVTVDDDGIVQVKPPRSKAGDYLELRAEMDLVCALTSCSAEQSNNGAFKPIDYAIRRRGSAPATVVGRA